MGKSDRDIIWDKIYEVYYDTYWVEIFSGLVISFWKFTDDFTKVLVALTASGSAITGWALWENQGFKETWIGLAGFAAVLSITHAALGVSSKVKNWTEINRKFTELRIKLETYQDMMELDQDFDINTFKDFHLNAKEFYGKEYSMIDTDFIFAKRLKIKSQKELNTRLNLNSKDNEKR